MSGILQIGGGNDTQMERRHAQYSAPKAHSMPRSVFRHEGHASCGFTTPDSNRHERTRGYLPALVALLLLACSSPPEPPPPPKAVASPPRDTGSRVGAYTRCKELAERQLRAPLTAQFQSAGDAAITDHGEGMYTVASYVDAQNAFGAMLRNRWTCTVNFDSVEQAWKLNTFQFEKR